VAAADSRAERSHRRRGGGHAAIPRHRRRRDVSAQARDSRHARFHQHQPRRRRRMIRLPPPEQWALCKMNEMEVAEMIERHIDFYVEKDGNRRSVHLPMQFVRHFMRRDDGALPTTVAYATMPLVLADGNLLAPKGLDRLRGIQFLIPDALRAVIPLPQDCTPERVKAAMEFLCDEWLVDVTADQTGKALLIAAALTLIERSLLTDRPCFFITAGRRGSGKSTAIIMLHGRPRGGAAKGADEPFHPRHALYPVGQHPARAADLLPAHRKVLHRGVLFRPPARRQRDSPRQRRDHPPLQRQQYRGEG
jgi:hypothetical protein